MATLDPIASGLKTLIGNLTVPDHTVKAYKWAPRDLDSLPAGVVEMPAIRRHDPDAAEDRLGTNDWFIDFPVTFYFDLTTDAAATYQALAVATIDAFIDAVDDSLDAGAPLNGLGIVDVKAVEVNQPEIFEEEARPQIRYRTRVAVFQQVL